MRYLFIFLALTCSVGPLHAQIFWSQTNGPTGGTISSITADSSHGLFISSTAGGVFESSDSGNTWHVRNRGLGSLHIQQLESGPQSFIYALTFDKGMFRFDRRDVDRWSALDTTLTFSGINEIAVNTQGHVFAATALHGIWRSVDNGLHWEDLPSFNSASSDQNVTHLTVSANSEILATTHSGKILHSTDDGSSFDTLPRSPNAGKASALLLTPDRTILIGDFEGRVYRSIDLGQHWSDAFDQAQASGVKTIFRSSKNGDLFFWNLDGHLFHSSNAGIDWVLWDSIPDGGNFYPSVVDPKGIIYTGSDFDGALRSMDNGRTFTPINNNLVGSLCVGIASDTKGDVYTLTEAAVYKTTDDGNHWQQLPLQIIPSFIDPPILCDDRDNVFVGTDSGVMRSTDYGASWQNVLGIPPGLQFNVVYKFTISPQDNIFAGTKTGVYRSWDHGTNWTQLKGGPEKNPVTSIIHSETGNIYAATNTGELFRTNDEGLSWIDIGPGSPNLAVVYNDTILFGTGNQNLLKSTDGGLRWQVLPLRPKGVFHVMIDSVGNLLASTDSSVYLSTDVGESWTSVGTGMSDPSATRLSGATQVGETFDHKYFAASRGQGVFRAVRALGIRGPMALVNGRGEQNYPNPFNASSTIPFSLEKEDVIAITIYNSAGVIVREFPSHRFGTGNHVIKVTMNDLPNGAYLYELRGSTFAHRNWMTLLK